MLANLVDYAHRHNLLAEPGFTSKTVAWAIDIDTRSRDTRLFPLGDALRRVGQAFPKCADLTQPELIGGGETRCHFLVETADVVALYVPREQTDEAKRRKEDLKRHAKHDYFLDLLRKASPQTPGLDVAAVCLADTTTLASLHQAFKDAKARGTDKVTLRVDGRFPVEDETWHEWWRGFRKKIAGGPAGKTTAQMVCLLSGELTAPLSVQPKVTGLGDVGGLRTGDALASFDKDSFPSFGLVRGENAAVSEAQFSLCRAALNHLLTQAYAIRLSQRQGVRLVHWFKEEVPPDNDPVALVFDPGGTSEAAEAGALRWARELLSAAKEGRRPKEGHNRFFVLTLSGAAGRVMVRGYQEGAFEELAGNVVAWFDDLAVVHREGDGLAKPPKLLAVVGALVRELKDAPPSLVAQLWNAALTSAPLPVAALSRAVVRTRIDLIQNEPFNHARMGLLRAFHARNSKGGDRVDPYLNPEHPEPAYQCGRLLAVLARLQYSALGDVGAGVVQRYYVAASQAPALTFGRLLANSKNHLQKLEGGLAYFFEGKVADVMARIRDQMPRTLNLEGQSLFALGYYQQIAAERAEQRARKNAVTARGDKEE